MYIQYVAKHCIYDVMLLIYIFYANCIHLKEIAKIRE